MKERKIIEGIGCGVSPVETIEIPNVETWIIKNGSEGDIMLAHADDGVIWGIIKDNGLQTSHQVMPEYSPELLATTLQDLRLFNEDREIRLRRLGLGQFSQVTITESESESEKGALDETHLLWGTKAKTLDNGFTLLEHGEEGLFHAIPMEIDTNQISKSKRAYVKVRHYIHENEQGVNRIAISRLVKLGFTS